MALDLANERRGDGSLARLDALAFHDWDGQRRTMRYQLPFVLCLAPVQGREDHSMMCTRRRWKPGVKKGNNLEELI
jgi:hypothetical protein